MVEQGGCRPVGQLADLLNRYQAPRKTQTNVAKRAGALIGRTGHSLPVSAIEHTIAMSMEGNRGIPDWELVEDRVGILATEVRHRIARRP